MKRLIDSERLRQRMKICSHLIGPFKKDGNIVECSGEGLFTGEILDVIDDAPTIDAVPVVKCRECKHWGAFKNGVNGWCNRHGVPQGSFWFCADGERKDGDR